MPARFAIYRPYDDVSIPQPHKNSPSPPPPPPDKIPTQPKKPQLTINSPPPSSDTHRQRDKHEVIIHGKPSVQDASGPEPEGYGDEGEEGEEDCEGCHFGGGVGHFWREGGGGRWEVVRPALELWMESGEGEGDGESWMML